MRLREAEIGGGEAGDFARERKADVDGIWAFLAVGGVALFDDEFKGANGAAVIRASEGAIVEFVLENGMEADFIGFDDGFIEGRIFLAVAVEGSGTAAGGDGC